MWETRRRERDRRVDFIEVRERERRVDFIEVETEREESKPYRG